MCGGVEIVLSFLRGGVEREESVTVDGIKGGNCGHKECTNKDGVYILDSSVFY